MAKTTNKEIVKQGSKEVGNPLFNSDYTGYENVNPNCLSIPFIKIAQSNSDEILEDSPSYIKGLKPGYFFNTVTRKNYGKTMRFIPIGQTHNYIEWGDTRGSVKRILTEKEFLHLSDDEKNAEDGEGKKTIREMFNLFVLLPDSIDEGAIIFPFASTKIRFFKKFLTVSINTKGPNGQTIPLFASTWEATTLLNKNDAGQWYNVGDKSTSTIKFVGYTKGEFVKPVLAAVDIVKVYIERAKDIDFTQATDKKEEAQESAF